MNFRRIYKNKVALCNGKSILIAGNRPLTVKKKTEAQYARATADEEVYPTDNFGF